MAQQGKRYRADRSKLGNDDSLPLTDAVAKIKSFEKAKFDQSVDLCLHLGIDARQADQAVRGSVALPHGVGKTKRVIAFCKEEVVEAAKEAGAIEAGGEELTKKIQDGWMEFDVAIASPDMMRAVSRLGRVLGPRGLMPSPKSGTVSQDVPTAVREYAAGKIEFRNDAGGNVHSVIGKLSFDDTRLTENADAFIQMIERLKPSATKGIYIKNITISGTMTPGVRIAV